MAQNVYALIVAIDEYKSPDIRNLRHCVSDSSLIYNYLLEAFGPHNATSNIRILRNEQATRSAIISTFRSHLVDNPAIQADDPVVFYFAGHGARTMKPEDWPVSSWDMKIEAICPYDERCEVEESGEGAEGDERAEDREVVRCIPDVTMGKLLKQLEVKGRRNITVILDCCHSGGGIRKTEDYIDVRCRDALPIDESPFPLSIDRAIWELPELATRPPSPFEPDQNSRIFGSEILMAACTANEEAKDGYFTTKLVEGLRKRIGVDTTVSDLTPLVPPSTKQHPVFQGTPNKIIFANKVIDKERRKFLLKTIPGDKFQVNAGSIHGIANDALFQLADGGGTLRVEQTQVFRSVLVRTASTPESVEIPDQTPVYAIPSLRDAVIAVWMDEELRGRVGVPHTTSESWYSIVYDPSRANALVTFKPSDGRAEDAVQVELTEPLFRNTGSDKTAFTWSSVCNRFSEFLDAIALFRYQLGRHSGSGTLFTSYPEPNQVKDTLCRDIDVALYKVVKKIIFMQPEDPATNLFNDDGVAVLPDSTVDQYGLRVLNKRKKDLYIYIFYFNPADLSIQAWSYLQASSVKEGETVSIGYGPGGAPIQFELDDPTREESGFVKVFVSTHQVERMDFIEQAGAGVPQQFRKLGPKDIGAEKEKWGAWLGVIRVTPRFNA
ncbi:hypothetical protein CC2G_014135 [Coprinopsis cinerea AmutBmut pab1-1]|nr:hypothetical protein CC2G_014135 [Coprinopsis cinerea AmutBmut pab1-1]